MKGVWPEKAMAGIKSQSFFTMNIIWSEPRITGSQTCGRRHEYMRGSMHVLLRQLLSWKLSGLLDESDGSNVRSMLDGMGSGRSEAVLDASMWLFDNGIRSGVVCLIITFASLTVALG